MNLTHYIKSYINLDYSKIVQNGKILRYHPTTYIEYKYMVLIFLCQFTDDSDIRGKISKGGTFLLHDNGGQEFYMDVMEKSDIRDIQIEMILC